MRAKPRQVRGFSLPDRILLRAAGVGWIDWQAHAAGRWRAPSINGSVAALRFFFTVTLDRPEMARHLTFVREPRKIPVILSPEEVARLLAAAPGPKYKAALTAAYAAGLRVSEVVALKVSDIDSERLLLRIEQGKGRKDRYARLNAPSRRRNRPPTTTRNIHTIKPSYYCPLTSSLATRRIALLRMRPPR